MTGGVNQKDFELNSDFNYVRGIHTMRAGVQLEGRHYRTDSASNYLGTFIFSSNDDFLIGKARNYTRRIGDPLITYSHLESAVYVQDDLRLRPNLTFSPGLRYEVQTHVHDFSGFGPRLGLTWAPGKNGRTTIRTSYGIFYNWLGSNVYEQTLRVNGVRQHEINIVNPTFPGSRRRRRHHVDHQVRAGRHLQLERIHRFSAAIDRTLSPKIRTSMTLSLARYGNQVRGLNVNAPINGVRPDPAFANVIVVTPDASMETYDLVPDFSVNFAGGIRNADQAKWNPKRTVLRFNYRHRRAYNNSDGAFSVPPTGSLDDQWAPASSDTRHRLRGSVSTQALRNLNAQINWDANSGAPYTITTGTDDNGDSIFNDRPVRRRATACGCRGDRRCRRTCRTRFRSALRRRRARPPGAWRAGGGGGRAAAAAVRRASRFSVSAQNLTNRSNYSGFSGVMTSPYFLQATSVSNPRQVDISLRFNF